MRNIKNSISLFIMICLLFFSVGKYEYYSIKNELMELSNSISLLISMDLGVTEKTNSYVMNYNPNTYIKFDSNQSFEKGANFNYELIRKVNSYFIFEKEITVKRTVILGAYSVI